MMAHYALTVYHPGDCDACWCWPVRLEPLERLARQGDASGDASGEHALSEAPGRVENFSSSENRFCSERMMHRKHQRQVRGTNSIPSSSPGIISKNNIVPAHKPNNVFKRERSSSSGVNLKKNRQRTDRTEKNEKSESE